MKKHIAFPSIEQFRNVCSNINREFNFIGLDDAGEPIYDLTLPKPTLTFTGTVKLHGTNAGVCYNTVSGLWAQSRENIITVEKDNAGFAFFVESNKQVFLDLIEEVRLEEDLDLSTNTISIYGEWCGANIQKGVGIANLEKSFFIFAVKISPFNAELPAYWVDEHKLSSPDNKIYNIKSYPTFSMNIDFNMPQLVQNQLAEITEQVEKCCPVTKAFGFEGIGEGIVWSCEHKGIVYRFKVKGEKHSSSKVKTLASVDVDKFNNIKEFVENVVTEARFNQALENVFLNEPPDIKKMGDLVRWVVADVLKEELDTMVANKIEPKDVNKYIADKVRNMFFKLTIKQ